jgi:hypothetical protein
MNAEILVYIMGIALVPALSFCVWVYVKLRDIFVGTNGLKEVIQQNTAVQAELTAPNRW